MGVTVAAVSVEPVTVATRPLLDRLDQLYIHDFSELDGEDVDESGRYPDPFLSRYWTEPDRHAFVIRADGRPAGFALVNAHSVRDTPGVRGIAEFFVLRKYRRAGVGRRAAAAVLDRFPGPWEIAVMRENVHGQAFWRATLAAYAPGAVREEAVNNDEWDGPVFSLAAPGGAVQSPP